MSIRQSRQLDIGSSAPPNDVLRDRQEADSSHALRRQKSINRGDRNFDRSPVASRPELGPGQDLRSALAAPAPRTSASWCRRRRGSSSRCGRPVWRSTTRWRASPHDDRASKGPLSRRRWRSKPMSSSQRIGEEMGSKCHLLVDARGVQLSTIARTAGLSDGKRIGQDLSAIVDKRRRTPTRRRRHKSASR